MGNMGDGLVITVLQFFAGYLKCFVNYHYSVVHYSCQGDRFLYKVM